MNNIFFLASLGFNKKHSIILLDIIMCGVNATRHIPTYSIMATLSALSKKPVTNEIH